MILLNQTHWHNQEKPQKIKRHSKNQHLRRKQRKTHFKKKKKIGHWFTPNLGIGEFTETIEIFSLPPVVRKICTRILKISTYGYQEGKKLKKTKKKPFQKEEEHKVLVYTQSRNWGIHGNEVFTAKQTIERFPNLSIVVRKICTRIG